jgi:hypothetical protein
MLAPRLCSFAAVALALSVAASPAMAQSHLLYQDMTIPPHAGTPRGTVQRVPVVVPDPRDPVSKPANKSLTLTETATGLYGSPPNALHDLPSGPKAQPGPPEAARLKVTPGPPEKALGGPDTKSLGGPDTKMLGGPDTKPGLRGTDKSHRLAR